MIFFRSVQSLFLTFILMLVTGIAIPLTYSGYVLMDEIIYQSGTEALKDKLESLILPIRQRYNRLHKIGLEDSEIHLAEIHNSALIHFSRYRYKKTGTIFVLSEDGHMVASDDFAPNERVADPSFLTAIEAAREGVIEYSVKGVEKLAVFSYYAPWGETIGLSIAKSELFAARDMFLRIILIVLALTLILAALSLLLLRKRIIQPLVQLAAWANEITRGNFGNKEKDIFWGEFSDVQRAFDTMRISIKEKVDRIERQLALIQIKEHSLTEALTELEQSEGQIRLLLDSTAEAIYGLDMNGNCTFANPACARMLGCRDANELIGYNLHDLFHHKRSDGTPYPEKECPMFQTVLSGNGSHGDNEVLWRADGSSFSVEYWSYPIRRDGEVTGTVVTFMDITERKQQEAKILQQAHFDTLTDLPNRSLALDRLSQLLNEARRNKERVAVLFMDLDDFKKINDTLGHNTGDKLLIEAAERLRSAVRNVDTVGRLGGDEFILLLGGLADAADAQPVVENLLNRFRDAFRIDGRELILTASVGIAVYPDDGSTPSELLRNSDSAMYHSKEQGRNTFSYFTDAMNREVSRRLVVEERMHSALDRGEFRLCYQLQVDVGSRSITGVEALLRWNNPVLGEVSPEEFIPIAEQTGLIVPIGQFVVTEALGMTARWHQQHQQQFTMAVNLSPRQFRDPNLVAFIEEAIHQSGVLGESLELEITEGVLMSGHAYINHALTDLNGLGVGIAMDDFGTGYSSLSYLRSYPFDTLKIDRSFVNDITVDRADRELVNASIAMAHGLGLKVVAEGVETEEQLALLAAQGCEFAQGYLFCMPVSAEEIAGLLESGIR